MKYEEIVADLKAGKYAPIYFLSGEESYFLDDIAARIEKNALFAFPAVIVAQIAGRAIYFAAAVAFGQSAAAVWNIIESGLAGLYIQAAVVPVIVLLLSLAVKHERD